MKIPILKSVTFLAVIAVAVAIPALSTVTWATRVDSLVEEAHIDDITCGGTVGCPGGPARCADFSSTEGGWVIRITCWATISQT